jgi:hypothetical protein
LLLLLHNTFDYKYDLYNIAILKCPGQNFTDKTSPDKIKMIENTLINIDVLRNRKSISK